MRCLVLSLSSDWLIFRYNLLYNYFGTAHASFFGCSHVRAYMRTYLLHNTHTHAHLCAQMIRTRSNNKFVSQTIFCKIFVTRSRCMIGCGFRPLYQETEHERFQEIYEKSPPPLLLLLLPPPPPPPLQQEPLLG